MMTKRKAATCVLLTSLVMSVIGMIVRAQPTPPDVTFNADSFAQLRKQIKPQPGESRWMEVPWFLDLHEARQKAAAEGKPLFIYSSGGATGIGAC